MPRGRPCKYGERTVSGKCPPKPKSATKKRACKYGERTASGKCPPKPKNTTSKRRSKYIALSEEDKKMLENYIKNTYGTHPSSDEALKMLEHAKYDPSYISAFSGKTYENTLDKEYFQVQDKIDAFFKYGDPF